MARHCEWWCLAVFMFASGHFFSFFNLDCCKFFILGRANEPIFLLSGNADRSLGAGSRPNFEIGTPQSNCKRLIQEKSGKKRGTSGRVPLEQIFCCVHKLFGSGAVRVEAFFEPARENGKQVVDNKIHKSCHEQNRDDVF